MILNRWYSKVINDQSFFYFSFSFSVFSFRWMCANKLSWWMANNAHKIQPNDLNDNNLYKMFKPSLFLSLNSSVEFNTLYFLSKGFRYLSAKYSFTITFFYCSYNKKLSKYSTSTHSYALCHCPSPPAEPPTWVSPSDSQTQTSPDESYSWFHSAQA